jgi:hypothetical protein
MEAGEWRWPTRSLAGDGGQISLRDKTSTILITYEFKLRGQLLGGKYLIWLIVYLSLYVP